MRKKRLKIVLVAGIVLALAAAALVAVRWRALKALRAAEAATADEHEFRFTFDPLPSATANSFEYVSAPAVFNDAVEFHSHLYIGGPAGLTEYDSHGTLTAEYRVGRELPPAPLVALATGTLVGTSQPQLLIATAGEGVLAFDGAAFRQLRAQNADARKVTALLPLSNGQLLIGTAKRGVLVYDGQRLAEFHPTLANMYVTALAGGADDLWVGTAERGVLHFSGGRTDEFGDHDGLPDRRVYAIAADSGGNAYVGTSTGVAQFSGGKFARVIAQGVFANALHLSGNTLLAGTIDQGVLEIPLAAERLPAHSVSRFTDIGAVQRIFASAGTQYALAQDAIFARTSTTPWRRVLERLSATLTDRNISALAVDGAGRVWVGYFDRGLDILDSRGKRTAHVEDENVFCVNRVVPDARRGEVAVATANGLVMFDGAGNRRQVLRRADGLMQDHVTDVVPYGSGMAIATPAGLTFLDSGGARSLYAFHGLVNNHVYALGVRGARLLAGTLGGVSVLDDENVARNYTTATSALKQNWVSAVAPVGNEWFVGTYGGGVARVDASGHVESFTAETRDMEINPNAMLVISRFVLAGTLRSGLLVYDRDAGRWTAVTAGLPSRNVTALAAADGLIYVGTDNGLVRIAEQSLQR